MVNLMDELAVEMEKNLNIKEADNKSKYALVALAHLEVAAELLEKNDMMIAAETITSVMEKVADKVINPAQVKTAGPLADQEESKKPLPKSVQEFIDRAMESAKKSWADASVMGSPVDESFFDKLLYVKRTPEGIKILDNFERFFDTIYLYTNNGQWMIRNMHSEDPEEREFKSYTEEQALQDASMLYTG